MIMRNKPSSNTQTIYDKHEDCKRKVYNIYCYSWTGHTPWLAWSARQKARVKKTIITTVKRPQAAWYSSASPWVTVPPPTSTKEAVILALCGVSDPFGLLSLLPGVAACLRLPVLRVRSVSDCPQPDPEEGVRRRPPLVRALPPAIGNLVGGGTNTKGDWWIPLQVRSGRHTSDQS